MRKVESDNQNGQFLRNAFRRKLSVPSISEDDMEEILEDLMDVNVPVKYLSAIGFPPPFKSEDIIYKFRTIVGWNDDGEHLSIAVRSGTEVELVHYSRVSFVSSRIVKLQKSREV